MDFDTFFYISNLYTQDEDQIWKGLTEKWGMDEGMDDWNDRYLNKFLEWKICLQSFAWTLKKSKLCCKDGKNKLHTFINQSIESRSLREITPLKRVIGKQEMISSDLS